MIAFPHRHRSRKPKSRFPRVRFDRPVQIELTPGVPSMIELPNGDRLGIWPDLVGGMLLARVHLLKRPKRSAQGSKPE